VAGNEDTIVAARDAVARAAWADAYASFRDVDGSSLSGSDLEAFADSAWWGSKLAESLELRQRAYAAYVAEGDDLAAAACAAHLSIEHFVRNEPAIGMGFLKRTERHMEGRSDCVELGYLALLHAAIGRFTGDAGTAIERAERAIAIGQRYGDANLVGNTPLESRMHRHLERLGPPVFDEKDRAFAEKIQATLTDEDISTAFRRVGAKRDDAALCDQVVPLDSPRNPMVGSTDVGDVSWVVPTVQAHCSTYAIGTPGHSWQLTAQGKTPAAKKGMVHVAKVMAATAVQAIADKTLIERAKADLATRTKDQPYVSPIPADAKPPLDMAAA